MTFTISLLRIPGGIRSIALALVALTFASAPSAQTIDLFAGGWQPDGVPATQANLYGPYSVALDASGNLFICDSREHRIRKVNTGGTITTLVGDDMRPYGDIVSTTPSLSSNVPTGIAMRPDGSLLVADPNLNRVRLVSPSGQMSVFAGNGRAVSLSHPETDGVQATTSVVTRPFSLAVDAAGNVYIAESTGYRIRKVDTNGIISTVAGTGVPGYSGDGGPATEATLLNPQFVAVDAAGNLYISDNGNKAIRKVDTSGNISTLDTGLTSLNPKGLRTLSDGSLVFVDFDRNQVFRYTTDGSSTLVAGTGTSGFSGDGGDPLNAQLNGPLDLAVSASDEIYVAEYNNNRVRRFQIGGTIETAAGSGDFPYRFHGDGGSAALAGLDPLHMAINSSDEILVADYGDNRVRKISADGTISTVAGTGSYLGYINDPASVSGPMAVTWLADGRPAVSEEDSGYLLAVNPNHSISMAYPDTCHNYAGGPCPYYALLGASDNTAYFSDGPVFHVTASGATLFAGSGSLPDGYNGDEIPASTAAVNVPRGLAWGLHGEMFIADTRNNRIRKVGTDGIIHTVAGNGVAGFSGDSGPATSAQLNQPTAIAVGSDGVVYIADAGNHRVRALLTDGSIVTIAGNGSASTSGNGGAPLSAGFGTMGDLVIDSHNNLYIVDDVTIRRMSLTNAIPKTVPSAPPAPTATAKDASATIGITAPSSTGGSAITGYTVSSSPSGGVDADAGSTLLSHRVTGLHNGTSYTFTVIATNAVGNSPPSPPSNAVTPHAVVVPPAPTARSDEYVASPNQSVATDANSGVLNNDSSAIAGGLTAQLASGPAHGTLSLSSNGGFTYVANSGFSGLDSFSYRACDTNSVCSQPAVASIQVGYVLAETDRYQWDFPADADTQHQGFLRLTNTTNASQPVRLLAWDSAGALGARVVSLTLLPLESRQVNSHDLEIGNPDKGLDGAFGALLGPWTLIIDGDRTAVRAYHYIRTPDGFLTTMHDRVSGDGVDWWVPTFNPAINSNQVSSLRISNFGASSVSVLISGVDDAGKVSATSSLTVPARATVALTASDIETGNAAKLLATGIGTGTGKWRLHLEATSPIVVQSLLSDPNGYLTNLSLLPDDGVSGSTHMLWFVPRADNTQQQGFIRITNRSVAAHSVTLQGIDDAGAAASGTLAFTLAAGESRQFNSQDLELGNPSKATGAFGTGSGDWRIRASSSGDLDTSAFIRTPDGFLTTMHDVVAGDGSQAHAVPIFNPASNVNQESRLRLVNPGVSSVTVTISARDDAGATAPAGTVTLTLAAGHAVMLTASDLETGNPTKGLTGHLGAGSGKWRLQVTSTGGDVVVMSLLRDPNGYLTNLSSDPNGSSSNLTP